MATWLVQNAPFDDVRPARCQRGVKTDDPFGVFPKHRAQLPGQWQREVVRMNGAAADTTQSHQRAATGIREPE